jgi:hypothetical protein
MLNLILGDDYVAPGYLETLLVNSKRSFYIQEPALSTLSVLIVKRINYFLRFLPAVEMTIHIVMFRDFW